MGICPPCRADEHNKHVGKYPAEIGKKGKLGATARQADCLCATCVKRSAPSGPQSPLSLSSGGLVRTGAFTEPICPDCGDPAHWQAKPVGMTNDKTSELVEAAGAKPRIHCYGCPQCVARRKVAA